MVGNGFFKQNSQIVLVCDTIFVLLNDELLIPNQRIYYVEKLSVYAAVQFDWIEACTVHHH